EGSYTVRMNFSKDGQQGTVPRVVFITSGGSESYGATAICDDEGVATFTVTYFGLAMSESASYEVSGTVDGVPSVLGNVAGLTSENPSVSFTVTGLGGKSISFSVAGLSELARTVECQEEWDRSSVSVAGECLAGVITFYVSNTGEPGGGDMDAPTTWRLVEMGRANTELGVLATGEIQLLGGETKSLTFPEFAGINVRLYVDQRPGHPGFSQPRAEVEGCLGKPELTVSGVCEYGTGRALFTINVPAGGANLTEAVTWNATGATNTSGSFGPANAGTSSNPIAVTTSPQGSATLSVVGYDTATATVEGCYKLTLDSVCWENTNTHTMRVNNANSVNVTYNWAVGIQAGNNLTAAPGQSTFAISGLTYGDNPTVQLFVNGQLVDAEQISDELCVSPGVEPGYECVSNGVYRFTADGIIFGTATYYIVDVSNGGWNVLQEEQITQADLPLSITFNSTS
ncbi:MAG: hypothetical protein KJ043_20735, partial [Anaerolineae bacterium]|nr:hypothetical protein [Anaerolineae bacterium]